MNDRTTSRQWERVAAVFDEAMARDASERLTFVRRECAGDDALRERVESMLDANDRPALLDRPAGEMFADLLDRPRPQPGSRLGQYQVESFLGAGGMGEVYRARDTTLGRAVAIKLLPADVGPESERIARFRREAKMLAALSHPNIAAIYGLEVLDSPAGPTLALVLELVDGETLAERLQGGRLPIEDALALARQIAEGVEAAHHRGIVHRDLKPANIKITRDGAVKVLDFGLAKLAHPDATGAAQDAALSPTITSPAFVTGVPVLLGTAAYMSPEQAKGREADKRSDVWAFGCVLFEMLAGRRPFDGDDIPDVLGAIVRLEPAWQTLPAELPIAVRRLLEGCLEKDPLRRIGDLSVAKFLLENAANLTTPSAVPVTTGRGTAVGLGDGRPCHHRSNRRCGELVCAGTPARGPGGHAIRDCADGRRRRVGGSREPRPDDHARRPAHRLRHARSAERSATARPQARSTRPFRARRGGGTASAVWLARRDGALVRQPRQWARRGPELRTVAVSGGPVAALCPLDGQSRGSTWGDDGHIVFATSNPETGLQRVPATGGEPVVLTRPDRARGEGDRLWPYALPGGRTCCHDRLRQWRRQSVPRSPCSICERAGTGSFSPEAARRISGADTWCTPPVETSRPWRSISTLSPCVARPVIVTRNVTTLQTGTAEFDISRDGTLAYIQPRRRRHGRWSGSTGGAVRSRRTPSATGLRASAAVAGRPPGRNGDP